MRPLGRAADCYGAPVPLCLSPSALGTLATHCLRREIDAYPKPGLVSPVDNGSHADMNAALLDRSAGVLEPFFTQLAAAGAAEASMDRLRAIGLAAEAAMLAETGGVNTHRGAIFGLGLLCAAAGWRHAAGRDGNAGLGSIVRARWGGAIARGPVPLHSHGTGAARRYGATGARGEAAAGFPSVYAIGLPALRTGEMLAGPDAACVQAVFALIARLEDTNLLHRGGHDGLVYAQTAAARFLAEGGVGAAGWRERAARVHVAFVERRLSPGGAADMLAMSLFAAALEPAR